MRTRAWWVYLLVMVPIVGLYLFGPAVCNVGPVFNAIGITAVAAILMASAFIVQRRSWPGT